MMIKREWQKDFDEIAKAWLILGSLFHPSRYFASQKPEQLCKNCDIIQPRPTRFLFIPLPIIRCSAHNSLKQSGARTFSRLRSLVVTFRCSVDNSRDPVASRKLVPFLRQNARLRTSRLYYTRCLFTLRNNDGPPHRLIFFRCYTAMSTISERIVNTDRPWPLAQEGG